MTKHLSIEGKLPEGYVILCSRSGDEFSFLVRNLGLSVECPHCGTTVGSTDLALQYYLGKPEKRDARSPNLPLAASNVARS